MELGQKRRRVRFTLPDARHLKDVALKEHGTMSYVNGTLIARASRAVPKKELIAPVSAQIVSKLPLQSGLMQRPVTARGSEIDFRDRPLMSSSNLRTHRCVQTFVMPSKPERYTDAANLLKSRHIVLVCAAPSRPPRPKMEDEILNADRFSRLRIYEDILLRKRKTLKLSAQADVRKAQPITEKSFTPAEPVGSVSERLFSADHSTGVVNDLLQRWNRFRYREETKLKTVSQEIADRRDPLETVSFRDRIKSDVRRFGCYKMSLEREPSVTTLLRAAREADEQLLKLVLKKILIDGISKEALNSTDKSGRTAISYICSTNLTNFLDVLLQIPGIDVNKPDNEGNTPLHFAAQAGQTDALNMLLTRCRNLQLDAKNCLGITPLMKAALQGRTRCAKLLLFAGASPMETDSGRGLTAEQWARFCGRESCADMLYNCTKARMLEKSSSLCDANNVQSKITLIRSKTNPCHSESFRSKFKKFLPFGFSIKDKQGTREVTKKERVSYLSRSTLCGSTPTISAAGKSQLLTTFVRPLEVPKLEVTPANNQHLIKKYEAKMASQTTTRSSVIR